MMKKSRKKFGVIAILLLMVCLGVWFFAVRPGKNKIRNVLLISIDTCRADYLSCYGYKQKTTPNIDAIAAEGILFENTVSPVPLTLPAHSSMFTGTIPVYHGIHDNLNYRLGESNITLAEILGDAGFATGAAVSAFVLDSQFGIDQGFDSYNDHFENPMEDSIVEQRRGDETTGLCLDWLEENKDERFFYFLHYYDPHMQYEPPEPFSFMFASSAYAGEIAYTDHCIGLVLAKLKDLDLYDSTLIIITADHGEMLGEHGENAHAYFIYNGVTSVPLVIKVPGRSEAVRIKSVVGLIDIVPTVCSLLDIEVPAAAAGIDLSACFGGSEISAKRELYCESLQPTKYGASSLLGVVTDRFKYIQTTRPELYDIVNDPAETKNLIAQQSSRARILKDKLAQIIQQSVGSGADGKVDLDDETRRRLESLGYVGGSVVEDFDFDQSKDDPKDVLDYHILNGRIVVLFSREKYDEAKPMAAEMIRMRPDCALGYQRMGVVVQKQEDYSSAVTYFQKALELDPSDHITYTSLGMALRLLGRLDEAIECYYRAIELRPDHSDAHHNLGIAFAEQGTTEEAVASYRRAIQFNPNYADAYVNLGLLLLKDGKIEEAQSCYRKALEIEPDFDKALVNLGSIFQSQNKIDQAAEYYRKALEANPDMAEAHHNLGTVLLLKKTVEQAFDHFHRALVLDADIADSAVLLAGVMVRNNKPERAVRLLGLVLENNPDHFQAHRNLGMIHVTSGRFDEAVAHLRKAIAIKPDDAGAMNSLAWVLATGPKSTTADGKEAVKLASSVVQLTSSQNPQALDTLAAAYAATGNFAKAIETAGRAVQLAGDNERLAGEIQGRLELYKSSRPYRETPPAENTTNSDK